MAKQPTGTQLVTLFLTGLCMVSFSMWLIWIPFIALPMLFLGLLFMLMVLAALVPIALNKMLK